MKSNIYIIFNIVLWLLTIAYSPSLVAQDCKLNTQSKKALKAYNTAEEYLHSKEFSNAESELKKAIKADDKFIEAYLMLGDVYTYLENDELAIANYRKATDISPDEYPAAFYIIANIEFSLSKYLEAKADYEKFLTFKDIDSATIIKAKRNLRNSEFSIKAVQNSVPFDPKNLGAAVNTKYPEYFPCLTVDGKTLLFTRRIPDEASPSGFNEDFFISYNIDGKWTLSENIGEPINTSFNEGAPCLSPDGQILIFTACEMYGKYGPGREGNGSCDLFFSRKNGDGWSKPLNIGKPINTANWETQPSYSSDGKTIYFIRGVKSKHSITNTDIYMSELGDDGRWKTPVRLSDKINTQGREESVFIHPDGQTLYFSSDGHPGLGGIDIFVSRKDKNGEWGEPVNLGYPINTVNDENSFMVSGDGTTAYMASNREGGFGDLDMYSFELPIQSRPLAVSYMKGKVFNKDMKTPVFAKFELIDLETGKLVVKSNSNRVNGEFLVCLPLNRNYALNINAEGYMFYSENFSFKDTTLKARNTKHEALIMDIMLKPIKIGESVVLKNIFFQTDKFELKNESIVELNKMLDLLSKNSKLRIEISGYTDNVGSDEHNLQLSTSRAKSVYDYLISHNISPDRLTYKGFGKEKPIDNNDTESGRFNNRRTEFKILSF